MNTFLSKVDAEREVLRVVNECTPRGRQLAGLSATAIAAWQRRNGIPGEHDCVSLLLDLGDTCQSLSDRSNENFLPLPLEKTTEINQGIARLREKLEAIKVGASTVSH
jgi:hypothetical protein